ncbi:hypothetical protein D3C81_547270 [compost metagenome]
MAIVVGDDRLRGDNRRPVPRRRLDFQRDDNARNARVRTILGAAVIQVEIDGARDPGLLQLAEQIARGVLAGIQANGTDDVGDGRAARSRRVARCVLAIFISGRLGFSDRVGALQQITETVRTGGQVAGRGAVDRLTVHVATTQGQSDARNRILARILCTVVVVGRRARIVLVDKALQGRQLLAEVVAGGAVDLQHRDVDRCGDGVFRRIRITGRLLALVQRIAKARLPIQELVVAVGIGGDSHRRQCRAAPVIGRQDDIDALQAAIRARRTGVVYVIVLGRIKLAISITIHIHVTTDMAQCLLAEVEVHAINARGHVDPGDRIHITRVAHCAETGRTGC